MTQSNQAFISLMKSLESQEEHPVVYYEPKAKPKDEGLVWQAYNDPPEYSDKYERLLVEYPDSRKHIGLFYDSCCNCHAIARKREIVKRMLDAGIEYTEWYCAPVFDLARELGLIEDQYSEVIDTCRPVLVPSVDKRDGASLDLALLQYSYRMSPRITTGYDAAYYKAMLLYVVSYIVGIVVLGIISFIFLK